MYPFTLMVTGSYRQFSKTTKKELKITIYMYFSIKVDFMAIHDNCSCNEWS